MSENKPFLEFRAVFMKTDAAIYFSHLDLNRSVSRALRRSKQSIWMSEGFTPRPHLVFTPPLPLGYRSTAELMDFRLTLGSDLDESALKGAFPDTLKILEVYTPKTKLKDIAFADYRITLDTEVSADTVSEIFSRPVELIKKTKRTEELTDITGFIKKLECTNTEKGLVIDVTLDCSQTSTLSPAYIIQALEINGIKTDGADVCRTGFRFHDMTDFK